MCIEEEAKEADKGRAARAELRSEQDKELGRPDWRRAESLARMKTN
jgi:hypothetical protein